MKRIVENGTMRTGLGLGACCLLSAVLAVLLWENLQSPRAYAEKPQPRKLMNAGSQRMALLEAQEKNTAELEKISGQLRQTQQTLEKLTEMFEEGKARVMVVKQRGVSRSRHDETDRK